MQFGKIGGNYYSVDDTILEVQAVEEYEAHPATAIRLQIPTDQNAFWLMMLHAIVEQKEGCIDRIKNEDGDATPDGIIRAKEHLETLRNIEKALDPMLGNRSEF